MILPVWFADDTFEDLAKNIAGEVLFPKLHGADSLMLCKLRVGPFLDFFFRMIVVPPTNMVGIIVPQKGGGNIRFALP